MKKDRGGRSSRSSRTRRPDTRTRKASRYLEGVTRIDPDNIDLLRRFVTEHGKIIPARLTGANARIQRQIKDAIRRARTMGLLP
jgi:small subunit ribosomal protein S18